MKIYIPSKQRAHLLTTHQFTKPEDTYIFVEPSEYKKYKVFFPELNIVNIKKNNQGISYVRNYILDYVKEDKFIMADDDVLFLGKRNSKNRYDKLHNFDEINKVASKALDSYAMYGMPTMIYATFMKEGQYDNKRIQAVCGYNKKFIKNIRYDQRTNMFEDFDFIARLMYRGYKICFDTNYAHNAKIAHAGGLSMFLKGIRTSRDKVYRLGGYYMAEKYGAEFVSFVLDKEGYICQFRFKYNLVTKRKDIVKENFKKYQLKYNVPDSWI